MKIEFKDKLIIVYLKKEYKSIKDIKNIIEVENYFKNLLIKIKNRYEIDISGFYNVYVYLDKNYGMVIEFHRLESDVLFISDNVIDLKITFYTDASFYLEFDDCHLLKNKKYLIKNNKYYLELKNNIIELIEQGKIYYKKLLL